jgi:dephospho-CoA kinase
MKKHITVAVTGGIGSGKSFLIEILKSRGFSTLSCDDIAKHTLEMRNIKKKLKKLFPTVVSGRLTLTVDRKKLAEIVFSDKIALKNLNALTHPVIIKETIKRAKKLPSPVFVEVPLLFEGGYETLFDDVIVVTRDKEKRIESVIKRTNMTREQVLSRMNNQFDYYTQDLSNYIVISNDGDKAALEKQLYSLLQNLFS